MYPVDLRARYGDGNRSRGLAALGALFLLKAWLLLPHLVIVAALIYAAQLVAWIGYWFIAFTGELPEFFHTFPTRVLQWQARTTGWLLGLDDRYPPFAWEDDSYDVQLEVAEGPGPRVRLFAILGILLLKLVALIPHLIVLAFVQIAAVIALWVGYVVVVFTGKLPRGIFEFTLGATRWGARVSAWLFSLTDEYPPFRLEA